MYGSKFNFQFPRQKVDAATKAKPEWYANSIDYIISLGLSMNDRTDVETKLNILHGNIPDEFYRKTLNPYNATKEKYKRFPAVMRNLDIMSDIVRRYISEYFKGVHQFSVGSCSPEVVINHDMKLKQAVGQQAQLAFQQEFHKRLQQLQQQAAQNGTPPEQVNPQDAMPDEKEFMEKFNQDYIDEQSKQGQDVLDYVRAITEDNQIYLTNFFNFCALGECYSYSEIRGKKIIKEAVPVVEAYPIPNNKFFVEDHDMFARKIMMSYNQILEMFDKDLSDKDRAFLEQYYDKSIDTPQSTRLLKYDNYKGYYADICDKFSKEEREFFKNNNLSPYEANTQLYEVWHVVWKGWARRGILTYVNEIGFQTQRIVEEDYQLNPEAGDIDIEWEYEIQVYEGYRIGNRYNAVYPIKARPIAFNRNGKLPYNGIMEVLPFMGKFSIIETITPFQILRNIISYHREMVIAKNKMLVLMYPKSLLANPEDALYRLEATGTLPVDDEEDVSGVKMQQVRLLNANMGQYITELTNLMESIKLEAREMVDMNAQRYGQITQSAGANTTQQAISQSAMGSVIITQTFDDYRRIDYNRDLDYAKLAFIDGLNTSYLDETGKQRFVSVDVNSFISSDFATTVRNDSKEIDKLQQLRQWAFSAAQNGDLDMAMAAITGDNVSKIKDVINKFTAIKQQHEEQMKQMELQIKEEEVQNKIREIQAKGEEDRKTEMLKAQYELQSKYIDVDMAALTDSTPTNDNEARMNLERSRDQIKQQIEQSKLGLERQRLALDTYNAAADRQLKREQMKNDLKIAKTNKNRYDK